MNDRPPNSRWSDHELYELNGLVKGMVSTLQSIEKDLHKITSNHSNIEVRLNALEDNILKASTTIAVLKWLAGGLTGIIVYLLAQGGHLLSLIK